MLYDLSIKSLLKEYSYFLLLHKDALLIELKLIDLEIIILKIMVIGQLFHGIIFVKISKINTCKRETILPLATTKEFSRIDKIRPSDLNLSPKITYTSYNLPLFPLPLPSHSLSLLPWF